MRFATTPGLDTWPACCVVRAHDCVRLKEPNDVNGAARPSEHCSKQSSDSPMPPLSSRLPAPHSSLTRNNMKGRQFPCLENHFVSRQAGNHRHVACTDQRTVIAIKTICTAVDFACYIVGANLGRVRITPARTNKTLPLHLPVLDFDRLSPLRLP